MLHSKNVRPDPSAESGSSDVTVAVLAAGHGTRMRSETPKHLHRVAGMPIVERVIRAGFGARARQTIVMVNTGLSDLDEVLGMVGAFRIVVQGPPQGTGDSVRQALEAAGDTRWLVSLLGDSPLLTPEIVDALLEHASASECKLTLLTCMVDDASTYGRIERDAQGRVTRVVEYRNDAPEARVGPTEINSGVMVLDAPWALNELRQMEKDPATGEFLLTDLIDIAVQQAVGTPGHWPVETFIADASVSLGVNDRVQLAEVDALARKRVRERHMRAGVTIIGPETVFIDEHVQIGIDSIVYPHSMVTGATVIGERCEIGPSSNIRNATIGNDVTILHSTIRESSLGDGTSVGPYAHLRGGCQIGARVHIGSYAEMKNARIADGAKCGHVSYLGDVTVGSAANIGAGTITANFDGTQKHYTTIGDGALVGSDSVLVAPVTVGKRARTGAGSVVTRNVPDDTLVMGVPARARQSVSDFDSGSGN